MRNMVTGEPCIVMMEYNGVEYIHIETLAEDFGDFVLKLVKEELDR